MPSGASRRPSRSRSSLLLGTRQAPPPRDFIVNTTRTDAGRGLRPRPTARCARRSTAARPTDTIIVPAGDYVADARRALLARRHEINGAGARSTIIDGNGQRRVFTRRAPAAPSRLERDRRDDPRRQRHVEPTSAGNGSGGGVYVQSGEPHAQRQPRRRQHRDGPWRRHRHRRAAATSTMIGTTVAGNTVTGRSVQGGGIGASGENVGDRPAQLDGQRQSRRSRPSAASRRAAGSTPDVRSARCSSNATIAGNEAAGRRRHRRLERAATTQISADEQHDHRGQHRRRACGAAPANVTDAPQPRPGQHLRARRHRRHPGRRRAARRAGQQRRPDRHARASGRQPGDQRGRHAARATDQRGVARPAGGVRHRRLRVRRADADRDDERDQRQRRHGDVGHVPRHAGAARTWPAARRPANAHLHARAGTFNVSNTLAGYTVTFGGDCSPTGDVVARREPEQDLHGRRQRQRAARAASCRRRSSARRST